MSEMIYKCRRCLKRPNMTYRPDPNEVLKVCAECGTENWCLPVGKEKGAVKAKKVSKAAEREVAESIPDEVPLETSTEDNKLEQESENPVTPEIEAESATEAVSERESLLAKLAALDSEETE